MVDQADQHDVDCSCRPCRIGRARAAAGIDGPAPSRRQHPVYNLTAAEDQASVRREATVDGPRELRIVVVGVPAPQGSMKAFIHKRRVDQKPFAVLTSDNPRTKGWRQTIADVVGRELAGENRGLFFDGPVLLDVTFYLPRPKDLLTIKKAARAFPHLTKPDLDKLLRAAADSLKHVVWTDDSQITDITTRKRYVTPGEYPRAEITIRDAPELPVPRLQGAAAFDNLFELPPD
jgi:crossover junction endodeoxyribonuclease RusA